MSKTTIRGYFSVSFASRKLLPLTMMATLVAGCQTSPIAQSPDTPYEPGNTYSGIPEDKITTATRKIVAAGIKALDENDLKTASEHFNLAVKTDVTNSYLQYLNSLAYHMRGLQGESSLMPLAETGYKLAIQFDKTNWLAQYYLGLFYLDQRKFHQAKVQFGQAALFMDSEPDLFYNLALAAYYDQDLKTAAAALEGARKHANPVTRAKILRASAIVAAAINDPESAQDFLGQYRELTKDESATKYVEQRVDTWQEAIKGYDPTLATPQLAQAATSEAGKAVKETPAASVAPSVNKQMVVVEVTIIRTEEDINDAIGVNLLQGLQLQFGNTATGQVGFSQRRESTSALGTASDRNTREITRFISIPAISYSLNIANANSARNEVLARPSLVALAGETSEFFSGVDILAAAVSGGAGDSVSVQKAVGVKLAVTPELLPNNLVKLSVQAERTFLTNPSASVVFDFRLDTTKTIVNANVVMNYGETLILSGLSEKALSNNRDGVPLLQDVPLVQYAFSRKTTREFLKSVLILVTPRKPQYTHQPEAAKQADRAQLSDSELEMVEFDNKYKDLFRPLPNTASVFSHMKNSATYREFRTGDLTLDAWNARQSHGDRLKAALGFIYY